MLPKPPCRVLLKAPVTGPALHNYPGAERFNKINTKQIFPFTRQNSCLSR